MNEAEHELRERMNPSLKCRTPRWKYSDLATLTVKLSPFVD
ncbi:hypothetical protein [Bradyrhizobium liaoningense]